MKQPELLARNGLTPNRALGQNFLTDPAVIARIADAAADTPLPLLEIGAGLGALTGALLARGARVTAVEMDKTLAGILAAELPGARVVTADFLDTDVAALMERADFAAAGNLPYYVTTPISEKLLCALPAQAVLMVQKEAAARFFAAPGERVYGPLAILSAVYYRAEPLFFVPPEAFYPAPEVDSAVVRLVRRVDAPALAPKKLLSFARRALAMRRKTLLNNLGRDARLPALLAALGLPQSVRAEAIAPDALLQICMLTEEPS